MKKKTDSRNDNSREISGRSDCGELKRRGRKTNPRPWRRRRRSVGLAVESRRRLPARAPTTPTCKIVHSCLERNEPDEFEKRLTTKPSLTLPAIQLGDITFSSIFEFKNYNGAFFVCFPTTVSTN
ncbi:hypothetical protein EVAR_22325_1 [Eumeta japonica]|uniref:Uncharacterized protein n=1 Tax=Eumeta variegata TaxID=151549 RepID=A0A4C1UAM1_EUMVA|nr:hypothetical protein EVAR_22325_1 [Eumeta japonica]